MRESERERERKRGRDWVTIERQILRKEYILKQSRGRPNVEINKKLNRKRNRQVMIQRNHPESREY